MRCCWKIMTNLLLFDLKSHHFQRNDQKDNKTKCIQFEMFRFWSFAQHHFCCLSLFIYFHCYFWDFFPLFAHICLTFIWCLPFWHFWSDIVCTLWCALNTIDGWRWDNELYSFFCIGLSENQRKSIQDRLEYFFSLLIATTTSVCVVYFYGTRFSSNGYWNENLILNKAKKLQTMRIGLFSTTIHDKKGKVHELNGLRSHLMKKRTIDLH